MTHMIFYKPVFLLQKRLTDEIAATNSEQKHIQSEFPSFYFHF